MDLETTETTCKDNLFFSPRNCAAFLNRRAVARRKRKLFQTSCFQSSEGSAMNFADAPEVLRVAIQYPISMTNLILATLATFSHWQHFSDIAFATGHDPPSASYPGGYSPLQVIVHKWQLTQMFTNHKWQKIVLVAIVNN